MSELNFIRDRRSHRRFTNRPVTKEIIQKLLESVRWSPSWGNSQCWELVVVTRQDLKERLASTLTARNPATLAVKNAPLLFAVCARLGRAGYYKGEAVTRFGDWFMFDLGLASQNLSIAAHLLGLGSVIVGAMDHTAAGRILRLPEEVRLVTLVPLGYPDQNPSPPPRRATEEFTHHELYGARP